ncbi:Hypothetical predicted protein [Cloeon dipterum]|uniref:Uncharacterized protein n=1 Tax=Cloeon dipterum TaxID=197152 RepID=A0A8S1DB00_9INSE|nr:Hypothetical predicted protein [Cloeon dipterum]
MPNTRAKTTARGAVTSHFFEPIAGYLEADGTYICTAFNPRCFVVQKVRSVSTNHLASFFPRVATLRRRHVYPSERRTRRTHGAGSNASAAGHTIGSQGAGPGREVSRFQGRVATLAIVPPTPCPCLRGWPWASRGVAWPPGGPRPLGRRPVARLQPRPLSRSLSLSRHVWINTQSAVCHPVA